MLFLGNILLRINLLYFNGTSLVFIETFTSIVLRFRLHHFYLCCFIFGNVGITKQTIGTLQYSSICRPYYSQEAV